MGLPLPGDEGEKYAPDGYKIEEIGPEAMKGKGEDWGKECMGRLKDSRVEGCIFGGKRS